MLNYFSWEKLSPKVLNFWLKTLGLHLPSSIEYHLLFIVDGLGSFLLSHLTLVFCNRRSLSPLFVVYLYTSNLIFYPGICSLYSNPNVLHYLYGAFYLTFELRACVHECKLDNSVVWLDWIALSRGIMNMADNGNSLAIISEEQNTTNTWNSKVDAFGPIQWQQEYTNQGLKYNNPWMIDLFRIELGEIIFDFHTFLPHLSQLERTLRTHALLSRVSESPHWFSRNASHSLHSKRVVLALHQSKHTVSNHQECITTH